jgi:hypothetical protein
MPVCGKNRNDVLRENCHAVSRDISNVVQTFQRTFRSDFQATELSRAIGRPTPVVAARHAGRTTRTSGYGHVAPPWAPSSPSSCSASGRTWLSLRLCECAGSNRLAASYKENCMTDNNRRLEIIRKSPVQKSILKTIRDLRSSFSWDITGTRRYAYYVSEQHVCPIFKRQADQQKRQKYSTTEDIDVIPKRR